jgi:hypothetical protein
MYSEDPDSVTIEDELRHFLNFLNSEDFVASKYPIPLLKFVINSLRATFPNVETILNNY